MGNDNKWVTSEIRMPVDTHEVMLPDYEHILSIIL